jgi:hypothetical protein
MACIKVEIKEESVDISPKESEVQHKGVPAGAPEYIYIYICRYHFKTFGTLDCKGKK